MLELTRGSEEFIEGNRDQGPGKTSKFPSQTGASQPLMHHGGYVGTPRVGKLVQEGFHVVTKGHTGNDV